MAQIWQERLQEWADGLSQDTTYELSLTGEEIGVVFAGVMEQARGEIAEKIEQQVAPQVIPEATAENLRELIRHMDIHSNYKFNGYQKMTTEQKNLYRAINDHDMAWHELALRD